MKIGRNDPCWCGSGKKYKSCHAAFDDKLAAYQLKHIPVPSHKLIKTPEQLEGIRKAGKSMAVSLRLWAIRASPRASAPL